MFTITTARLHVVDDTLGQRQPLVERLQAPVQLQFVQASEDFAHSWSWFDTEIEQMAAEDDRRRGAMFDAERARPLEKVLDRRAVERSRPSAAVRHGHAREQLEVHFLRKAAVGTVADRGCRLGECVRLQVVRDNPFDLASDVVAADRLDVQAGEERLRRSHSGLLVVHRPDAAVDEGRREGLAEIVTHGAKHDGQLLRAIEVGNPAAGLVDDEQRVHPDVSLWMPLRFLWTVDERPQLWKQPIDHAELERERETDRRPFGEEQQLLDLAPDAFGGKIVQRNAFTERLRARIHLELETRGKLNPAQHAQAVVTKGSRVDGTEHAALEQVTPAIIRIEVAVRRVGPMRWH